MLAAVIRDRFNLPGERPEVCGRMVNKAIQRSLWKHNGVPSPNFCVVTTKEGALSKIESFGFPLIIKPSDSSGSRGVTKLESASDDIGDAISRAFQFTRTSQVLIESFMEGNEFTVESFLADGKHYLLAITEKKKVEGTRGTVASELATPERPPEVLQRISQAVISAYDALQYRNGPGHAEVILMHDGSVGLVEVAGRGGGFLVFDKLIPAVSGINIARITAMQAVGIKLGTIDPISRSAVLRFFPSRHGILTGMQGFDSANLLEGVEAGPFASLGDRFSQATVDGDRLGYILSQGDTPSLAQLRADTAESLISFEISP
jgi:biotin carboxylase